MATAHVYIRVQVSAADADIAEIAEAVEAVHQAVVSAGGEWNGSVSVTGESIEAVPPSPPAEEIQTHEDSDSGAEPVGDAGVPLSSGASNRGRATVAASRKPAHRKVR